LNSPLMRKGTEETDAPAFRMSIIIRSVSREKLRREREMLRENGGGFPFRRSAGRIIHAGPSILTIPCRVAYGRELPIFRNRFRLPKDSLPAHDRGTKAAGNRLRRRREGSETGGEAYRH
jgi:hypothetical protein